MGSIFCYGINYNGLGVLRGQQTPPPPPVYVNCNHNKTLEKLLGTYYDHKVRLSILFAL